MKKHWLRGMLLGVSMALLLSGGVALAQGLWLTVDRECVPCYPGAPRQGPPPEGYGLTISFGDWDPEYDLCERVTIDGDLLYERCDSPPEEDPFTQVAGFPCTVPESGQALSVLGAQVDTSATPITSVLGEWTYRLSQTETGQSAQVSWVVAEDCSAYEFVPEPGSILLLGSGLMGLAGYAGLRWRTRQ